MSTTLPWNPLCVRDFFARWQGQLQPDQVAQQWHEAAARTQAHVPHGSRISSPSVVIHSGQRQMPSASRRRYTRSDNTHRSLSRRRIRYVWQVPFFTRSESVQPSTPLLLPQCCGQNSVPWHVSPTRPAILSSATNIWAGVQDSTLQRLSLRKRSATSTVCSA
jgi:hypothetical protein